MRNKWGRSLGALALALGMFILALPAVAAREPVNLENKCSLTINPGGFEDLTNAGVVVDLYKVADTQKVSGYDTYGYVVTSSAYGLLESSLNDLQGLDSEGWRGLAAQAADIVLKQNTSLEKAVEGAETGKEIPDLDSGLYLVIARGSNINDYTVINDAGELVTIARSDKYIYSFYPELVSLPSTETDLTLRTGADGEPIPITTDSGTWQYILTATLKPLQEPRYGTLEIVKNLLTYEDSQPANFVFQIEAYEDSSKQKLVYSDVVSITFQSAGEKKVLIENKIPAGSYVEVTEVYTGITYTLVTDALQTAVISADAVVSVSFTNDYDDTGKRGGSITNRFEYEPNGGWQWIQDGVNQ